MRHQVHRATGAILAAAAVAIAGCSSDVQEAGVVPRSTTGATIDATVGADTAPATDNGADGQTEQIHGTLRDHLDVYLHPMELNAGDAIRAVLRPTSPLQAGIVVFGEEARPTPTLDAGRVLDRADESELEESFPGALLAESTDLTDGCESTQNEWLAFIAPFSGTYWLGVTRNHGVAGGPGDAGSGTSSGDFTLDLARLAAPEGALVSHTRLGYEDGQRLFEMERDFLLNPAVLTPELFVYGATDTPYDARQTGCVIPNGLDPASIEAHSPGILEHKILQPFDS